MQLTFHGGAQSVTGANYLLACGKTNVLIDCGLTQGANYCEARNFDPFPYDPKSIDAVIITHAHIDHTGRLPMLFKAGFRGAVFSTPPTKDCAELLLLDSEHILTEEAKTLGKEPPYLASHVVELMRLWKKIPYHEQFSVGDLTVEFFNAGHILGSSSVAVTGEGKRVIFSGDLGNSPSPLIRDIEYVKEANYALIESAYGGRLHETPEKRRDMLEDVVEETMKARGVLMIPVFAMERTQALLYELNELVEHGRIPRAPIFMDSPLAIKLTAMYQKYSRDPDYFNRETIGIIEGGDAIFNFPGLVMTLTREQSRGINTFAPPKIIIAGSGMSEGGRILHHELRYLSDPKNTILFLGYQAWGSRGRAILDGAKHISVFGEKVAVQCQVRSISGYSAHADQAQLVAWVSAMRLGLKKVFVVQGEEDEARLLAQKIRDELAVEAEIPSSGESVVL